MDFDIPMFESDEFGRNAPGAADAPEAAFRADLSGFDGPLDLLLDLAKKHRIDLRALSMNDLADQYLLFVQDALHQRLELAADYLVMAAWLVYLKSRLLLPEPVKPDEPATADLVGDLTARLRRLEAVRRAREWLSRKADLVAETFPRGTPERPETRAGAWAHTLDELAAAYARQRQDKANRQVTIAPRLVWTLQQGRETLAGALAPEEARSLEDIVGALAVEGGERVTATASTFAAALEMTREGAIVLAQAGAFEPLFVRAMARAGTAAPSARPEIAGTAPRTPAAA